MTNHNVEKRLLALVQEILPPDPKRPPLSRATRLLADPAIDSLTMASLGFSINTEFGISTEELVNLIPKFQTVDDMVKIVEDELKKA